MIPSTAPRQSFRDALQDTASPAFDVIGSTPARPAAVDMVEGTPVRGSTVDVTPVRQGGMAVPADVIPGSSPLMMKRGPPVAFSGGVRSLKDAFRAPVKPRPAEDGEPAPEGRKMSVYERLGWDDEFDDL